MPSLLGIQKKFRKLANPSKALILERFFKTGLGEYGEGDHFLGVTIPAIRTFSKLHTSLSFKNALALLQSKWHEERMLAVVLLVSQFKEGTLADKERIYKAYLTHAQRFNNWDFVDLSAPHIVGSFLEKKSRSVLDRLAASKNLWERRISIVSTFHFIRLKQFDDTFRIAEKLLSDKHDLIHKAVGWMLREAGKRDLAAEETFLKKQYGKMPRTMLRYAIEKFREDKRKDYLQGKI